MQKQKKEQNYKENASIINLTTNVRAKTKTKARTKTIIPPKKQQRQKPKCFYKVKAIYINVHSYTYIYICTHIMMPTQPFQKLAHNKTVGGCWVRVRVMCIWDTVADIDSNTDDSRAGW